MVIDYNIYCIIAYIQLFKVRYFILTNVRGPQPLVLTNVEVVNRNNDLRAIC